MLTRVLENGLEVALQTMPNSKMASLQFWTRTGALHENDKERGMSHLLEHMLFKGTDIYKTGEISERIEALGGDINAYTSFDRTVYYVHVPSRHLKESYAILKNFVFHSTLDEKELTREKEVVVEEIKRSLDSPGSLVGYKVFEVCYPGSNMQFPILGTAKSVRATTREALMNYYKSRYTPNNMAFVATGYFDEKELFEMVQDSLENYDNEKFSERKGINFHPAHNSGVSYTLLKGDFEKPKFEMAFPSTALENFASPYLDLICFALGGGELSRLSRKLKDELGLVSSVYVSNYNPSFPGLISISCSPLTDDFETLAKIIYEEVEKLKTSAPITASEKKRAVAQMKAEKVFDEESTEARARLLGTSLMTNYKTHFEDLYFNLLETIRDEDLESIASRFLDFSKARVVALCNEKSKLNSSQFSQQMEKFFQNNLSVKKQNKKTTKLKQVKDFVSSFEKKKGYEKVHFTKADSKLFSLSLCSFGGLLAENEKDVGSHFLLSSSLGKATQSKDFEDFSSRLEEMGAELEYFSGKDSFGMKLSGLKENEDELLALAKESFLEAKIEKSALENARRSALQAIDSKGDQPARRAFKKFGEVVLGHTPYRWPVYGSKENLERLEEKQLENSFKSLRQNHFVSSYVGSKESLNLTDWFADSKGLALSKKTVMKNVEKTNETIHIPSKKEQNHILVGCEAYDWKNEKRYTLAVLSNILGGMGGRLFLELRDKQSLAYTVSPVVNTGVLTGSFSVYMACSPEKTTQALDGLRDELSKVSTSKIAEQELKRAQNSLISSYHADLEESPSLSLHMALMQLYGVGYNEIKEYDERVLSVRAEEILEMSQSLFAEKNLTKIVVGSV